ncbi:hypothetical protein PT040_08415 [Erysipelothrix rhusiopathiae]|nr:hypothetical protein [Erysipelothrix rhusiopathiae]
MKQLELKDFLNYTYLASLTTSPAKKHMAFIKSNARYDENDYVHDLYLTDGSTHKRIFDLGNDSRYFGRLMIRCSSLLHVSNPKRMLSKRSIQYFTVMTFILAN